MAQKDRILEHLQKRGSITSLMAIELYGVTRLSAVIFDLKNELRETKLLMEEYKKGTDEAGPEDKQQVFFGMD